MLCERLWHNNYLQSALYWTCSTNFTNGNKLILDYEHFIVIITAREEPAINRLVTDKITGWFENKRWKLETSGEWPIILEEYVEEYTSNEWKQNRKMMSTCNRLDLESRGSWLTIYTSRKHCKKESQLFFHCGSFDHPDLQSLK